MEKKKKRQNTPKSKQIAAALVEGTLKDFCTEGPSRVIIATLKKGPSVQCVSAPEHKKSFETGCIMNSNWWGQNGLQQKDGGV